MCWNLSSRFVEGSTHSPGIITWSSMPLLVRPVDSSCPVEPCSFKNGLRRAGGRGYGEISDFHSEDVSKVKNQFGNNRRRTEFLVVKPMPLTIPKSSPCLWIAINHPKMLAIMALANCPPIQHMFNKKIALNGLFHSHLTNVKIYHNLPIKNGHL